MAGLDVRLLGEVTIRADGEVVTCSSTKAVELLGLLVTRRHHPVARDAVAEALWPDERADTSRRYLRQTLWRLNAALQERGTPYLRASRPGRLQVDVAAFASVDLVVLEEAHAATADVPGADLGDPAAARLEAAVAGCGGEFLAGVHQDWCVPERVRVQEIHLSVRDQLVGYCEARGQLARALDHGRAVLDVEPARETTHRLLMNLHHRRGDRAAAVRQYQRCVAALEVEYGVGPSAPTALLHRRIRADHGAAVGYEQAVPAGPEPAEIAALHERLAEIQATLDMLVLAVGHAAVSR